MKRVLLTLALSAPPLGMAQAGGADAGMALPMRMSMHMHATMQAVMADLRHLSGQALDRAFYSTMIPHHQSAIEMSRAALPPLHDPVVRA